MPSYHFLSLQGYSPRGAISRGEERTGDVCELTPQREKNPSSEGVIGHAMKILINRSRQKDTSELTTCCLVGFGLGQVRFSDWFGGIKRV